MSRVFAAGVVLIAAFALFACGGTTTASAPSPSAVPPSPRWGASLVYDAANRELVLFGGATRSGALNETWTWDGKSWRLYHVKTSPPAGQLWLMAYDQSQRDVLLFGEKQNRAVGGVTWTASTWSWNGSSWKELHPQVQADLDVSWEPTMGFDPVSRTVLLFGFSRVTNGTSSTMQAQTWSWNGQNWKQVLLAGGPQTPGQLVVGGSHLYMTGASQLLTGGRYVDGIWEWDGSNWIFNAASTAPFGSAAFDQKSGTIVSFNRDTWTWDGSSWVRQHPQTHPAAMGYMAYFPPLREIVMWGDVTGSASNDMWAWDGTNWRLLQAGNVLPSPTPGHRDSATPAEAAALIRQTVTSTSPVLLPTWLPEGLAATVDANQDYFNVIYQTDQRDKQITFAIAVANPPPATGLHAAGSRLKFRNALAPKFGQPGYADYMIYDTTDPGSQRWLMWTEPGTMSASSAGEGFGGPGVPYFLSATGFTDQEFWQIANSLQ